MFTRIFDSEISARQLITEIILILLGYILLLYISNSFKAMLYLFSISLGTYIIAHIITYYNLRLATDITSRLIVPAAFLAIIGLNNAGLINTLTGSISPDGPKGAGFIAMPFYLLSAAAYLADVASWKMRDAKPYLSFRELALYLALPFKLLSGPLETPSLSASPRQHSYTLSDSRLIVGFSYLTVGLFMKCVIGDRLDVRYLLESVDPILSFICAAVFELKFYFDFAGYSLMVLGAAKLLNIRLTQNFNHPFTARNVVQFWHLWHVSLGGFLQKYILRRNLSLFEGRESKLVFASSIFLVSAMWHGGTLNYLLWGVFHGAVYYGFITFFKKRDVPAVLGFVSMILFFVLGRMLAIDSDIARLLLRLQNMFDPTYYYDNNLLDSNNFKLYYLKFSPNIRPLILASIFIMIEYYQSRILLNDSYHTFRRPIFMGIIFIIFLYYGVNSGGLLYARL